MTEEKNLATGFIGNALRSTAADHTTTFADEIFDTERQQYQNEVNTDLEQAITDEVTRAQEAEMENTSAIETEKKRAEAAEQAIIFDVSSHNDGAVFESLQALLSDSNLSTLIPTSVRHGGVTIRFIQGSEQGSDNKYVQYRLMADEWSTNTDEWGFCGNDVLVENPEWIYVLLDAEKRILAGFKSDGSVEWSIGVPAPVKTYIDNTIAEIKNGTEGTDIDGINKIIIFLSEFSTSDTLKDLLDAKVDKVDGKSLISEQYIIEKDNPEFVKVLTDSNKRIIVAIRNNGDVYYGYGVPSQIIKYIQEYVQSVKNEILGEISKYDSTFDNSESVSDLGNLQMTEPEDVDYFVILMYGQSLSMGDETIAAFAEENITDCLMLGDNIRSISGSALNVATYGTPNENGVIAGKRQDAVTTAVKSFISLYKKERPYSKTKFIIGSMGISGASLAELSGATRYPNCTNHYLDSRVTVYLNALNSIAEQEEKTICLGAVLWMQGEADYGVPYIYKTYAEWLELANEHISERPNMMMRGSKDAYYQGLKYLKEDIESLATSIFGQSKKPNFFAYSTAGAFIDNAYMTINSATTQLADDTDNFFLLAPTYQTPDFEGGHLTMNGYRWYGEYIAKALYNVYIKRAFWNPLRPTYFKVINNKIYIYFSNGVWPLILNTWTAGDTYKNYGFTVRTGTVAQLDQYTTVLTNPRVTITNIQVISKNCIEITCDVAQFGEAIEIIYAGQGESGYTGHNQGAGNVCDSDRWKALFTYKNDADEHSEVKRTSHWSGYTEATQEEAETLDYWNEDTTYNTGDKCLVGDFTLERARVVTSIVDSNNVYPYNRINNRPTTKTGDSIVGELYPMQNWCINFYKRIIL